MHSTPQTAIFAVCQRTGISICAVRDTAFDITALAYRHQPAIPQCCTLVTGQQHMQLPGQNSPSHRLSTQPGSCRARVAPQCRTSSSTIVSQRSHHMRSVHSGGQQLQKTCCCPLPGSSLPCECNQIGYAFSSCLFDTPTCPFFCVLT
jgi:hypothetical protein